MRVLALLLMGCGLLFAASSAAQDGATGLASDDDASGYLSAFKQRALDAASRVPVKGVAYSMSRADSTSEPCSPAKPMCAASKSKAIWRRWVARIHSMRYGL